MTSLNYERRINLIKPFLAQFYAGFEIPREWGPERTAKDITETAELVNSEISSDVNENYLNHLLEQMAANIKKAVKSRRLPAAGVLIDALNKVRSNKVPEDVAPRTTADMSFDGIEARRFNAGEPVREGVVFGTLGRKLVETKAVSQETLSLYQRNHLRELKELYGADRSMEMLRDKYPSFFR